MTAKPKTAKLPAKDAPAERSLLARSLLAARKAKDEHDNTTAARLAILPSLNAAEAIQLLGSPIQPQDIVGLVEALREQVERMGKGDLSRAEAMLMTQAHTLNAMFTRMLQRGASNMGEHLGAMDTYMRLALKAQSQCARTLEVLAAMKNPPSISFVRQANITAGAQQINNGIAPAENLKTVPNELLEITHGSRLDSTTQAPAGRTNPHLDAVDKINGGKDSGRKSAILS